MPTRSLPNLFVARFLALLFAVSGVVSLLAHPLNNVAKMSLDARTLITVFCLVAAVSVWFAPWNRWPQKALLVLPPLALGLKAWANQLGGLGPYSYSIHFVVIYVWMGVALPRGAPLAFSPLLAASYLVPLYARGEAAHAASLVLVAPLCVFLGEAVAWISNRLRRSEQADAEKLERMEWLVEAATQLADDRDRQSLARHVARLATQLPGAAGAAVLFVSQNRILQTAATADWSGRLPESFDLAQEPLLLKAVRDRDLVGADDEGGAELAERLGVARVGVAPLFGSRRCLGLVLLARESAAVPFDGFYDQLARTLCVQVGLALERIQVREALRDAALHDELTGVGNRRKANARLEQLASGDALLLIDLDHFKRLNDTRGHAFGDEVLQHLASHLTGQLRDGDEVFRMGGEEFLVVLHGASGGARVAAERLHESWRAQDAATSFSAGLALHEETCRPAETLERADVALYAAKDLGRDRLVLAD